MAEAHIPLLPGWFTLDETAPHLLASRCLACTTFYFPPLDGFCRNPACSGESFEPVELSRIGSLWSYTMANFEPPRPYIAADPFLPFAIAAVELSREKMIILGPVIDGVAVGDLEIGAPMELVLEPVPDEVELGGKLAWKWMPLKGRPA